MALSKAAGAVGGTLLLGSVAGCILTPEFSARKAIEVGLLVIPFWAGAQELRRAGREWEESLISVYVDTGKEQKLERALHITSPFRAAGRYYLLSAAVCALPFYYMSLKSTQSFVGHTRKDSSTGESETVFGVVNEHDASDFKEEAVPFHKLPASVRKNHAVASAAIRSAFWPLLSISDTRVWKVTRRADGTINITHKHWGQSLF